MRRTTLRPLFCAVLSALGVLSLTSCGENTPSTAPGAASTADNHLAADPAPRPQLPAAQGAPGAQVAAAAPRPAALPSDAPLPPRDAQWTLLAFTDRSPTHVQNINRLKQDLIQNTHRSEWYAIHNRDESNLYFGFYRTIDDPSDAASTARAQNDKQFVRGVVLTDIHMQQTALFKDAGFYPLSAPDPAAPPEWNLFNKDLAKRPKDPTRAYWSLQIMAFKSNPLRKEAAVQAVQALRKQGVDAYYYHGDTVSSVCVGAWPMDAVEAQEAHGDHTAANPDDVVLVLPGEPPKGEKPVTDDGQGHRVVTVAPVLRVRNPGMKAMIAKYPFHAVNYEIHRIKGTDGVFHEDSSFVVLIPRAPGNGYYDSNDLSATDLAAGRQGGPGIQGGQAAGTGWLGLPARSSAGSADPSGQANPFPAAPTAPGIYGAQLRQEPAPSDAAGAGHLRRVGE